jgi:CRISPR/Cas system-associated exonuclease Cas4 (RecB family)
MIMKNNPLDYITSSMVTSYDCPRKYYYEYLEGWKPVRPSANLVFGSIIHDSIAGEYLNGRKAENIFLEKWDNIEEVVYSRNDSHESLKKIGLSLIEQVKRTEVYQRVVEVEKAYQTELPDGTVFKGKIDLIYDNGKEEVLLDWKTSSSLFLDHRPDLDDQLTAYSMLTRIPKVAYGVLLKKKNPDLKFYHARRTQQDYLDYQLKVMKVVSDIESGFFFKKPSLYCNFCPFTPLCRNQKEKIAKELKRAPVEDRYEGIECEEVLVCPA